MSKSSTIIIILTIIYSICSPAQSLRYFEFNTKCFTGGNNSWEDSSFIAATSSKEVIDSVLSDLAKPDTLRKMIHGLIDTGNGGYNHNGTHWFLWHFKENNWQLTEGAIEMCDGCPTNVDKCVSCYMGIGGFCPWSSSVTKEISITSVNELSLNNHILVYPNPVNDILQIELQDNNQAEFILLDITSKILIKQSITKSVSLRTEYLENGVYFYELRSGNMLNRGIFIKE